MARTLEELTQQVAAGIDYFTHKFISAKRNDLTAAEFGSILNPVDGLPCGNLLTGFFRKKRKSSLTPFRKNLRPNSSYRKDCSR